MVALCLFKRFLMGFKRMTLLRLCSFYVILSPHHFKVELRRHMLLRVLLECVHHRHEFVLCPIYVAPPN
jgi:hypothetical protein